MGWFADRKLNKVHYDVKAARAARAIFPQVHGALPKIQLTFETTDGTLLELDLDHVITADFLDQADAALEATMPSRRQRKYFNN